jgi:phage-related protein
MEWLGITEDIDSWSELLDTRFGTILKTVGAIGVALGAWKIGTGIYAIFTLFQNSGIVKFFGDVAFAIGAVAAKAATLGEAITYVFSGAAGIISGVATAIVGLFNYVTNLISMLRDGESVSNVLGAALGGLTTAAGGFLIAIGVGATVATGGIVALIIGIVAAVGMLTAVIINHWDEIKAAVGTAWTWLYDTVLSPIVDWFSGVATWFKDHVITPIVEFFRPVVKAIIDMAVLIYTRVKEIITGVIAAIGAIFSKIWEIFLKVVEIAVALGNAFYTYVIQPVVDFIVSIAVWVYEHAIKPIVNFFAKAGTWLYDTIITPVLKGINWLKDQAVALFTSIGTTVVEFVSGAFKAVINGILSTVEKTINGFIKMLNGAIELINKIPGVSITKVSLLSIPRLAEGGVVNEGQMFIAREAGPEMVGSIGNRTAVVNNDQIVESVSRGVYQAVVSAMGQSGGAQVVEAKVNDKVLFEVIVDRNRRETIRTGASPLLGGV